jgi:hypothetical protein
MAPKNNLFAGLAFSDSEDEVERKKDIQRQQAKKRNVRRYSETTGEKEECKKII